MLGYSSERRLLHLLEAIRDGEVQQERLRQNLCQNPSFAPYSAFMRMDRDANESVSIVELVNFFRDNREFTINSDDCANLIKYFDSDDDSRLSF